MAANETNAKRLRVESPDNESDNKFSEDEDYEVALEKIEGLTVREELLSYVNMKDVDAAKLGIFKFLMLARAWMHYFENGGEAYGHKLINQNIPISETTASTTNPDMEQYYWVIFQQDTDKVMTRYHHLSAVGMRNQAYYELAQSMGFIGKEKQAKWSQPVLSFIRGGWNYDSKNKASHEELPSRVRQAWTDELMPSNSASERLAGLFWTFADNSQGV
mmetsp:Transcript_52886/g.67830  ORF Transcript_52886/g.67830 Transcript_52886/m.67830 type:complete len:218 (-) Transcript_52886:61-714(-)